MRERMQCLYLSLIVALSVGSTVRAREDDGAAAFWRRLFGSTAAGAAVSPSSTDSVTVTAKPIVRPTLYSAGDDVFELDGDTFDSYVYNNSKVAVVVKFYAHWCGHCRRFTPFWKELGTDVADWSSVVSIAAINCADSLNAHVCTEHNVRSYPDLRYFSRNAHNASNSHSIPAAHSVAALRDTITGYILDDYANEPYGDWPNLTMIGDSIETYGQLWEGVPEEKLVAIVFQNSNESLFGAQMLLELSQYDATVSARRVTTGHVLTRALEVTETPAVVVLKHEGKNKTPTVVYRSGLVHTLRDGVLFGLSLKEAATTVMTTTTEATTLRPADRSKNYYVSETDLLKAAWRSLKQDVPSDGGLFIGSNYTALVDYLQTLIQYFPLKATKTVEVGSGEKWRKSVLLPESNKARLVFSDLLKYMTESGSGNVTADNWTTNFELYEKLRGSPFPVEDEWRHCAGSRVQYRGYTCGLWTLFHTLTVNAYLQHRHQSALSTGVIAADIGDWPTKVFQSIRGWVEHYFDCQECKRHFLKMTSQDLPQDELLQSPSGLVTYLWRAHNRVNARLAGDTTEDPRFPKYQFPPAFLCSDCRSDVNNVAGWDRNATVGFLVRYYTDYRA